MAFFSLIYSSFCARAVGTQEHGYLFIVRLALKGDAIYSFSGLGRYWSMNNDISFFCYFLLVYKTQWVGRPDSSSDFLPQCYCCPLTKKRATQCRKNKGPCHSPRTTTLYFNTPPPARTSAAVPSLASFSSTNMHHANNGKQGCHYVLAYVQKGWPCSSTCNEGHSLHHNKASPSHACHIFPAISSCITL